MCINENILLNLTYKELDQILELEGFNIFDWAKIREI